MQHLISHHTVFICILVRVLQRSRAHKMNIQLKKMMCQIGLHNTIRVVKKQNGHLTLEMPRTWQFLSLYCWVPQQYQCGVQGLEDFWFSAPSRSLKNLVKHQQRNHQGLQHILEAQKNLVLILIKELTVTMIGLINFPKIVEAKQASKQRNK